MSSEFKQQLKIQMRAREVSSFDSWSRYLKFVTAGQRAVHSESDSSLDDAVKDGKKKIRSLKNIPVGERKTPKDLFPNSLLTKDSEWLEGKGDCVFDFNNVQCPYGDKCFRTHVNSSKSSSSSAATNGSNSQSPKIRAIDTQMRKLSAQKARLQLEEEESGILSSSSAEDDPHKAPPLPPYRFPSSSRSSGSKN